MRHTLLRRCVPPVAIAVSLLFAGCAGSNANRASRSGSGQVKMSEAKAKAEDLALRVSTHPDFVEFREAAEARGEELVVAMTMDVGGDDDTSGQFAATVERFKRNLPEAFRNMGVARFRDMGSREQLEEAARRGGHGDTLGLERDILRFFDTQDFSPEFEPGSGNVTTGQKKRAVVLMTVIGERQELRGVGNSSRPAFEFGMDVSILDLRTGVGAVVGSLIWESH